MGDNFKVEVRSEGRKHFEAAVRLAWSAVPGGKATHYMTPIPEHNCDECYGQGQKGTYENKERIDYTCPSCNGQKITPSRSGIVLLWGEDRVRLIKATPLPFPLAVDAAVNFLWDWLETADFGQEPDHDGSNGKGFIVTTGDFWGHVEGSRYAFIGVYADWQMYGK